MGQYGLRPVPDARPARLVNDVLDTSLIGAAAFGRTTHGQIEALPVFMLNCFPA
jgi:hypothetical protein